MGGVSVTSIFNVIVGVGLILMCLSGVFTFQPIDNELEGFQKLDHTIRKRAASAPGCEVTCPEGPSGQKGESAVPGIPGVPGVPGTNCDAGGQGDQGPKGEKGDSGDALIGDTMTSCDALKKAGFRFNGMYMIDPDGPATGLHPFLVACDMTSDPTKGYTTIHHNKEEDGNVNRAEAQGSFRVDITYVLASTQIEAIKRVSTSCRQFIKYACIRSLFKGGYHFWVSVTGEQMFNWGGVPTGISGCACWITRTCDDITKQCNCDLNDDVPRFDQGYLTDKATLPVSQLRFGDTGSRNEKGVYTLGPLQCA